MSDRIEVSGVLDGSGISMRELAREIARTVITSSQGAAPRIGDLYCYFLRCFDGNADAAEAALAQYLEGNIPPKVLLRMHEALGEVVEMSDGQGPGQCGDRPSPL
jgi:hypothetical protein